MNHAISGEILVQEVRFPRSEIFLATLVKAFSLSLGGVMNKLTKNVPKTVQNRPKSSILMGGQPDFC